MRKTRKPSSYLFLGDSLFEFSCGCSSVRSAPVGGGFSAFIDGGPTDPHSPPFAVGSDKIGVISGHSDPSIWLLNVRNPAWCRIPLVGDGLPRKPFPGAICVGNSECVMSVVALASDFRSLVRIDVSDDAAAAAIVECVGDAPAQAGRVSIDFLHGGILVFGGECGGTWSLDVVTDPWAPRWRRVALMAPHAEASFVSEDFVFAAERRGSIWHIWKFARGGWTPAGAFLSEEPVIGSPCGFLVVSDQVHVVETRTAIVLLDDIFKLLKRKQKSVGMSLAGKETEVRGLQSDIDKLAKVRRKMRNGGNAPVSLFTEERAKGLRAQVIKLREQFVREAKEVLANHAQQLNPPRECRSRLSELADEITNRVDAKNEKFSARMAQLDAEAAEYTKWLNVTPERVCGDPDKSTYERYLSGLRDIESLRRQIRRAEQKTEKLRTRRLRESQVYLDVMTEIRRARTRQAKYAEKERVWKAKLEDSQLEVESLSVLNNAMKQEFTVEQLTEKLEEVETHRKEMKRKIACELKAFAREKLAAIESLRRKIRELDESLNSDSIDECRAAVVDCYQAMASAANVITKPL